MTDKDKTEVSAEEAARMRRVVEVMAALIVSALFVLAFGTIFGWWIKSFWMGYVFGGC